MRNFVFISPHFPDSYWKFCLALRNRGWNVLGIGDAPYNEIPLECQYALTEYYCCNKMEVYENEKAAVQYFYNKYGPIDFLESNNEYWLEKDARLRKDFNIISGVNTEEVKKFKHKSLQKKYFTEAGVKSARFCLPKTKDEIIEFAALVGYPLFAKPDKGVGSQGTFKIKSALDIDFFLKNKSDCDYILEEFVDGDIISFDGICNSLGDVQFSTQDVFAVNGADIINDNCDDSYYCNPFPTESFKETGKRIVKAFNPKVRFFHIEFFVLKSDHPYLGKKGTIVPLEANMRPAGGYTPDLINYANSISCYDIYADVVSYDENRVPLAENKYYAVTSSRRYNLKYTHSDNEIFDKYRLNICMYGEYPDAIKDDMGDYYFFAKFVSLDEVFAFDKYIREKNS